jgi:hypothetical protein
MKIKKLKKLTIAKAIYNLAKERETYYLTVKDGVKIEKKINELVDAINSMTNLLTSKEEV